MNNDVPPNNEDVEILTTAIQEGRPLRAARAFQIDVSDESLQFRQVLVNDPVPLGRQILEAAGARSTEEFSLYALLPNGDSEDVRLDEPFDLRGRGAERFVYFRTDRAFKFTVDNRQFEWGKPSISGSSVRKLAVVADKYNLFLEVRGGHDKPVNAADIIDLTKPGVERFITVIRETTEGLLALPSMDREYLESHKMAYELESDGKQTGVILKEVSLPAGKFDHESVEVMILLPQGYPDARPDMFFLRPWVKLTTTGSYPNAADQAFNFRGHAWQRWSRHSEEWRSGVDGLHTMIARVRYAIENAR